MNLLSKPLNKYSYVPRMLLSNVCWPKIVMASYRAINKGSQALDGKKRVYEKEMSTMAPKMFDSQQKPLAARPYALYIYSLGNFTFQWNFDYGPEPIYKSHDWDILWQDAGQNGYYQSQTQSFAFHLNPHPPPHTRTHISRCTVSDKVKGNRRIYIYIYIYNKAF